MKAEIEKRAEDLGVDQSIYKSASVIEGLALYGFRDELDKLAKDEDKKEDKKEGKKEEKKENKKGEKKEDKKGEKKEDKKGEKKEKNGKDKNGKDEKGMSKKEKFLEMIKKKKGGKGDDKEQKKESSFFSGFKDGLEKNSALGSIAKKVAPYLLGGAGVATGGYAIASQKKETAATRAGIQGLASGTGRALGSLSMRQKWNDMRDQINEGRLKKGVNVNRRAILSMLGSKNPGK